MEVDFRTISDHDIFVLRLKDEEMDFGFIPRWRRAKFIRFCKNKELIIPFPDGFNETVYKANAKFRYQFTFSEVPFAFIFEWLADLTYHRYWKIWPDFYYTNLSDIDIRRRKGDGFDWISCHRTSVF